VAPNLILLDLHLMSLPAGDFLPAVRERSAREIPVLLVTAAAQPDRHAERLGVDGALAKPFEIEELLSTVRRLTHVQDGPTTHELEPV
jgi:CheY-like chemotaxis protein